MEQSDTWSDRQERLRKLLDESGADLLALVPGMNLYYVTGVRKGLSERPLMWVLRRDGARAWMAPELEEPHLVAASVPGTETFTYADGQPALSAARRLVEAWGVAGRAVQVEAEAMRVLESGILAQAGLEVLPEAGGLVSRLRMLKDRTELALFAKAVEMVETALEAGIRAIKPGVTEREVARVITLEAIRLGSERFWKDVVVASGPNGAMPHTSTSDRTIEKGDIVVIDAGAVHGGYVSDITRTVFVGEIRPGWEARYESVLAANRAGVAAARPGVALGDIDAAARQTLAREGLDRYFVHRVGHGLGLEGHEPPYLVPGSTEIMQPGTLFTVEPGVYFPGEGGIRIEDDVVCTETGAEVLTSFDRGIRVVG